MTSLETGDQRRRLERSQNWPHALLTADMSLGRATPSGSSAGRYVKTPRSSWWLRLRKTQRSIRFFREKKLCNG
jgi:hypothetical protein